MKSATHLETYEDTHDGFAILINILKKVLPQVVKYGALIYRTVEFDKSCIKKSSTHSQLASRHIILKRTIYFCKDDFPPHKVDKTLRKYIQMH